MRFEYCCDAMLATLVEGVAVIYENGIEFDGGITLNYCPFCGEKVVFTPQAKNNSDTVQKQKVVE